MNVRVFHQPKNNYTLQIGCGKTISQTTKMNIKNKSFMNRKIICLIVVALMIVSCSDTQNNVVPMGELDAFWRNHPVLGPHLQGGLWLYEITSKHVIH